MKHDNSGWHLVPRFVGNTLLLHETHTSYVSQRYTWHPVYGWDYGWAATAATGSSTSAVNNIDSSGRHLQHPPVLQPHGGRGQWRTDRRGARSASGNSMYSFRPEGQGFISHMPAAAGGGRA